MATLAASMPANQLRSQLSSAYCTTSRKGGEVTTRSIEALLIVGVDCAAPVISRGVGWAPTGPSPSSEAVFFRISFLMSRSGGVYPLFSLIFRCDCADTAWFGGSV